MYKTILICIVLLCSFSWAISDNVEMFERFGIQNNFNQSKNPPWLLNPRPQVNWASGVLMIPDWTTDSVGLFDPYDGRFIKFHCKSPNSSSPKNAIQGPDNNIYLADQVGDVVDIFDTLGTYLGVYANAADGLDNVRGIAFRDNHLFICVSPTSNKAVKEFSGPHTFVRDFINYTGNDPFDIHFLPDGRCLFSDIGTSDKVALHDTNGQFISQVLGGNFPQQIQDDPVLPGAFLNAMWGRDSIIDFEINGTVVQKCTLKYPKGVYRLGNGNILATSNYGLWEINTTTGEYIRWNAGTGWQYIELYSIPGTATSETDINKKLFANSIKIYPNPFQTRTEISYLLNNPDKVSIKIYNCLGSEVQTLINRLQTAGKYSIFWDGKDKFGNSVPNGIYMCHIKTSNQNWRNQLIMMK